ncbi:MAG: dTDP-4-dehydrorhamnose 3,5-epimerase [Burkholderiaceae bacterium]
MKVTQTAIADVLLLEPEVFGDQRGFFFESYNARSFKRDTGLEVTFVQDNHSRSSRHVLRGLHYQIRHAQGKLVRVILGRVRDVAVDLRRSSPTFGRWVSEELSAENQWQLWIPPGFAHGFVVLSDVADFLYKATDYYDRDAERTIVWNDPDLAIDWRLDQEPLVEPKDRIGARFRDAETFG